MMTRDEVRHILEHPLINTSEFALKRTQQVLAHDQAQRAVIEGLSKKVKELTAWSDKMFGTPCEEIRHQQKVEELEEKIDQQAKEIESHNKGCFRSHPHDEMNEVCELKTEIVRLKNELSHWSWVRFKELEEGNNSLREALQLLYDMQNGCPLPKYTDDWCRAMELAQRALKEVV